MVRSAAHQWNVEPHSNYATFRRVNATKPLQLFAATLERIAILQLNQEGAQMPNACVDAGLRERRSYQEGLWTDPPDFSPYDRLLEDPPPDQSTAQQEQKWMTNSPQP